MIVPLSTPALLVAAVRAHQLIDRQNQWPENPKFRISPPYWPSGGRSLHKFIFIIFVIKKFDLKVNAICRLLNEFLVFKKIENFKKFVSHPPIPLSPQNYRLTSAIQRRMLAGNEWKWPALLAVLSQPIKKRWWMLHLALLHLPFYFHWPPHAPTTREPLPTRKRRRRLKNGGRPIFSFWPFSILSPNFHRIF